VQPNVDVDVDVDDDDSTGLKQFLGDFLNMYVDYISS
jgi:hypothetical protein